MKILIAVDGSKPALHAVKQCIKLMSLMTAASHSVTLVSVHDDAGLRHAQKYVGHGVVADYLRELSEKDLKPAQKLLDTAGLKHNMDIRTGHVAQEIVACSKAGKFDLLILGAKGRSALVDMLLGSVAQRVLAMSTTPVLLVK